MSNEDSSFLPDRLDAAPLPANYRATWLLLQQNDPATLEQLYHDGYSFVRRHLKRSGCPSEMLREEAKEVMQNASLRFLVYCANARFDFAKPPHAVFYNFLQNTWYEHRRRIRQRIVVPLEFLSKAAWSDDPFSAQDTLSSYTLEEGLLDALTFDLKPDCREVIRLKYFEKMSYVWIAGHLNRTTSYVGRRLHKCREYLLKAAMQRLHTQSFEL